MWIVYALGAAVFAGFTAVLAKAGVKTTPSSLATALRTVVVLAGSWLMVALVGSAHTITGLSAETWLFLGLSGLATGGAWLFYFRALSQGPVSKVAVIDRSSIVLTILLGIIVFGETQALATKIAGVLLIGVGSYLMVKTNPAKDQEGQGAWLFWAFGAAIFASLTSILGKVGIAEVDSNLGTAIRTMVVLVMAWVVVFVKKEFVTPTKLETRELVFIGLSGLATTGSWLFFWKAMQEGPASVVVPIDKLSIVVTVGLAALLFGEKQSPKALLGLALLVAGTLVMVLGVAL